jgi:hypothetical protein
VLGVNQTADIFGDAAPRVSDEDVHTVNKMEKKIEQIVGMVSSGWKDGESVVATKVSRDRARLMADKLAALRKTLAIMERDLRQSAAQGAIVLDSEAA